MVKYADDKDKPHIRACFNAVPKQLAKENKKYQWSKVESGGRGVYYKDSLQWLEDADIIRRCYNSNITGLPLEGNAIDNVFLPSGNIQRNTALSTSSSLEIITLGVMATC